MNENIIAENFKDYLDALYKRIANVKPEILKKYELPEDTDDDTIRKIDLAEQGLLQCETCTGLDNCKQSPPGFKPVIRVVHGYVDIAAGHCKFEYARQLAGRISSSKIPAKFIGATFDDYTVDEKNSDAVKIAREILESGNFGAYFYGKPGTGKTFLTAILAQALIKSGKSSAFVNVPNLLKDIKTSWDNPKTDRAGNKISEDVILSALYTVDVLILDDLGAENQSAWSINILYGLINERYNADLPTVVTSNFSLEDMEKLLIAGNEKGGAPIKASQIIDRFYDTRSFKRVKFFGDSRRRI